MSRIVQLVILFGILHLVTNAVLATKGEGFRPPTVTLGADERKLDNVEFSKEHASPTPQSEGSIREIPAQQQSERPRIALVLGNSNYAKAPKIPNPVHDADLISGALVAANFTVIEAKNLDHQATIELLKNFAGRIGTSEAALFYYSGHAVEVNGENYLMPVDVKVEKAADVPDEGLSISSLLSVIASADTNIIVLDSCRDNPFQVHDRTRGIVSEVRGGLAPMKIDRSGTYVAYSTSPGSVALDGDGEYSPFALAFSEALALPGLEIEQIFRVVRRNVFEKTRGQQRPWSNSSLLESFYFIPPTNPPTAIVESRIPFTVSESVATSLGNGPLVANEELHGEVRDGSILPANFWSGLKSGVNILRSANGARVRAWFENRRLEMLPDPYQKSFAVIAAIDKYEELNGQGYRNLGFMVDGAKKLRDQLVQLGFPRDNIFEFYDEKATKENIEAALGQFWEGEKAEKADRLIFYFGGHGDRFQWSTLDDEPSQRGVLVTRGFEKSRPMRTGVVLDDIIGREFRNTSARQFLVLIDACSSGLVLPRFQADEKAAEDKIQRLATLNSEASKPTRAILVAGTGEERALWANGGIFTSSLVKALSGAADWNHDGLIMFDELALQVRLDVKSRASQEAGVEQVPASFAAGPGKFIFVLP